MVEAIVESLCGGPLLGSQSPKLGPEGLSIAGFPSVVLPTLHYDIDVPGIELYQTRAPSGALC